LNFPDVSINNSSPPGKSGSKLSNHKNKEIENNKDEDEDDDYDGHERKMLQRKMLSKMRTNELKDIKFGNTKTKVVSFHKGQNTIHEADREKGTSIIANLTLSKKDIRLGKNPFARRI